MKIRKAAANADVENQAPFEVTYTLSILSMAELKKPAGRCEPKGRFFVLSSDSPWIDVHSQIKIQFCNALYPLQAAVPNNSFETTYSIPCIVPNALPLDSEADHAHLITNVAKMKKDPAVKLVVKEVQVVGPGNHNANVPVCVYMHTLSWSNVVLSRFMKIRLLIKKMILVCLVKLLQRRSQEYVDYSLYL